MMLAEQGKLSLQDDITKFFPDYPTGGKRLTVENLLTHTSGVKDYLEKLWKKRQVISMEVTNHQKHMDSAFKRAPLYLALLAPIWLISLRFASAACRGR